MVILAKTGQFYVVKATLEVAEEISHLMAAGNATFSLVMRPEADIRTVDVSRLGETTNKLISKYGLPVPEVFPPGHGPHPDAGANAVAEPGLLARSERQPGSVTSRVSSRLGAASMSAAGRRRGRPRLPVPARPPMAPLPPRR